MGTAIGLFGRRSALVAVCVCLVIVAGGGWALAATGGGVIHACANKKTGTLRLAGACKKIEKTVSWNARGAAGAVGPQGPAGAQGAAGAQGDRGPAGPSTGPAGGDLSGSYPNPTVATIGGHTPITSATSAGGALSGTFPSPSLASGSVGTANFASGATSPNASELGGIAPSGFWQPGGNAGTNPATDYVGTSDNEPLNLDTDGIQGLELQPSSNDFAPTPNLIGGDSGNTVSNPVTGATIAGGGYSGHINSVTADFGTVSGGAGNTAGASVAVPGGEFNTASGEYSTASGDGNTASLFAATAFGDGNSAGGDYSVALGDDNTAGGQGSVALGQHADDPSYAGSFVWSDGTQGSGPTDFSAGATKQFDALATNGFNMQLSAPGATYTGCTLTSSSGWACSSDRNVKHAFRPISDQAILKALLRMPIESWSYKIDATGTRHIGPTAQDFKAAFHIGSSPRLISMFDEGGVALAAIKGLASLDRSQATQIAGLHQQLNHQQAEISWLMAHARTR